jgi:aspartate racemase
MPQPSAPTVLPAPRTLGVLGGMGPLATADFYTKLVELTPAARDREHIPTLIRSVPQIPERLAALLGEGASPGPALVAGARQLVLGGAELLAMPCNTAHAWWGEISAGVPGVPLLHIVDAVLAELARAAPGARRVGLLATSGTLRAGIYLQRALQVDPHAGWQWLQPDEDVQREQVTAGIAAVKAGAVEQGRALLGAAAQALVERQGAQVLVAACTEVPIALSGQRFAAPWVDSSLALARLAVERCLAPADHG